MHAAAAEGDDQELRKCLEGLDIDRDGLFDRTDPQPRVIAGSQPGTHGRYNHPVSVGTKGSCGDTPLHKAAAAGQATSVAYIMSLAATGLPIGHGIGEDSGIGDHRGQGPRTNPPPWEVGTEENAHVQRVREPNAIEILVAARNDAGAPRPRRQSHRQRRCTRCTQGSPGPRLSTTPLPEPCSAGVPPGTIARFQTAAHLEEGPKVRPAFLQPSIPFR